MTSQDPAITVRDIEVGFRRRRRDPLFRALDSVSIDVPHGRTVGVIGESGSGKSTLARAILGLVPVQSGTITVGKTNVTGTEKFDRTTLAKTLQAVFQDPTGSLNPSYTIGRSLAEPIRAQGIRDRKIEDRVAYSLERVGLDPSATKKLPREFSGGQRQRICIARALMTSPQFLVCDEAVSALDLSVQAQILNLLVDLQAESGLSYLFISHDMNVVRRICHDTTVLYRGKVMERGPTSSVGATPAHPYTRALLLAAPIADPFQQDAKRSTRTKARDDTVAAPSLPAHPGCPFADRCPFAVPHCRTTLPPLRAVGGGVSVACHRYPEWKHESAISASHRRNCQIVES